MTTMSPRANELVFRFSSSKRAWCFARAAKDAGAVVGFPSLKSPWTVRTVPLSATPSTLGYAAARAGGMPVR